jgi:heptosyltransferase-2
VKSEGYLPTMDGGEAASSPFTLHPSRVLVIQTAFLGDVILTTPLLAALAREHGPVDLITTPAAASLVERHPAVREVIRYDKRGQDRGAGGFFRLVRQLRQRRYERAYLPHRSWRSGALAWLAGIRERIGFSDGSTILYTSTVKRPEAGHEVERLLALAGPGVEPPVSLVLEPEDRLQADRWLADHGISGEFIALAPGSIWGTKRWPYYGELVRRLSQPVVVVGGKEDCALGESIVAAGSGRASNASGELSLRASAALIAKAQLLVTNDSAPLHMATAAGTPIVAIFGPTLPSFGFGPRGQRDRIVEHDHLACRPCSAHGPEICPLGHHRCMRELGVEQVIEAIEGVRDRGVNSRG